RVAVADAPPEESKSSTRVVVGAAIAAAVLVVAVGVWRAAGRHAASAPTPAPRAEKLPAAPTPPPPPAPTPPRPPAEQQQPAPPPAPVAAPAPVEAVPEKVTLVIATEPPGADVCLAKDRVLIGKTKLEWTTEKSARRAHLLIRMPGYHGQELTVGL